MEWESNGNDSRKTVVWEREKNERMEKENGERGDGDNGQTILTLHFLIINQISKNHNLIQFSPFSLTFFFFLTHFPLLSHSPLSRGFRILSHKYFHSFFVSNCCFPPNWTGVQPKRLVSPLLLPFSLLSSSPFYFFLSLSLSYSQERETGRLIMFPGMNGSHSLSQGFLVVVKVGGRKDRKRKRKGKEKE